MSSDFTDADDSDLRAVLELSRRPIFWRAATKIRRYGEALARTSRRCGLSSLSRVGCGDDHVVAARISLRFAWLRRRA